MMCVHTRAHFTFVYNLRLETTQLSVKTFFFSMKHFNSLIRGAEGCSWAWLLWRSLVLMGPVDRLQQWINGQKWVWYGDVLSDCLCSLTNMMARQRVFPYSRMIYSVTSWWTLLIEIPHATATSAQVALRDAPITLQWQRDREPRKQLCEVLLRNAARSKRANILVIAGIKFFCRRVDQKQSFGHSNVWSDDGVT